MAQLELGRSYYCCGEEMSAEVEMFNGLIMYYCCGKCGGDESEAFDGDDLLYIRRMLREHKKLDGYTDAEMVELRRIYLYKKVNPEFTLLYPDKPMSTFSRRSLSYDH